MHYILVTPSVHRVSSYSLYPTWTPPIGVSHCVSIPIQKILALDGVLVRNFSFPTRECKSGAVAACEAGFFPCVSTMVASTDVRSPISSDFMISSSFHHIQSEQSMRQPQCRAFLKISLERFRFRLFHAVYVRVWKCGLEVCTAKAKVWNKKSGMRATYGRSQNHQSWDVRSLLSFAFVCNLAGHARHTHNDWRCLDMFRVCFGAQRFFQHPMAREHMNY